MKWFKHHTDETDREFLKEVLDGFGHEGYTVYFQILEVMGIEIERELEDFRRGRTTTIRPIMTVGLKFIADRCRSTPDFIRKFAAHCKKKERFSVAKVERGGTEITIEIPNLLDDSDEYLEKAVRRICKERGLDPGQVLKVSGHCPDSVGSESGQCRARADKSRQEKKRTAEQSPPAAPDPGASPGEGVKRGEPPASPPPSPPPTLAAVAAASPPSREAAPSGPAERLELPNPTLGLLLLLPLGMDQRVAQGFAMSLPLREIAAVAREAGRRGVQDPAAWARKALQNRWKRGAVFSLQESTALLTQLEEMYANAGIPPARAGPVARSSEFAKAVDAVVAGASKKNGAAH